MCLAAPGWADEGHKAQICRLIADKLSAPAEARIVDKLFTFKLSRAAWEQAASSPYIYQEIGAMAGALSQVAQTMGLGNTEQVNGDATALQGMIDSWQGKLSCLVVLNETDNEQIEKGFDQLQLTGVPVAACRPRGAEFHLEEVLLSQGAEVSCKISADGKTYRRVLRSTRTG